MKTSSTPLLASAALIKASYLPHLNVLVERAPRPKCQPIDYTFQANVPYVDNSPDPTLLNFSGLQFQLPRGAKAGNLISFFGNFVGGQVDTTQVNTTQSTSTSNEDPNAPSYTNGTADASSTGFNGANQTIITTTFSQGDSASAVAGSTGGNPDSTTSTSTSSSGNGNSTAVVVFNELGDISIFTSAEAAEASNLQSVENQRLASSATSCATDNEEASAEAEHITSVTFTNEYGLQENSEAYAACSAGTLAPTSNSTSTTSGSSSGSQASISGVTASVTCNGVTTTNTHSSTTYKVIIKGQFCSANAPVPGFSGAIAGQRCAKSSAEC